MYEGFTIHQRHLNGEAAHRATDFDLDAWLAGAWSMVPSPTKYDVSLVDPEFVSTICEIRWLSSQNHIRCQMADGGSRSGLPGLMKSNGGSWVVGRRSWWSRPRSWPLKLRCWARRTAARYDG